jgi:fused signal recognition particle receptor
MKQPYVDMLVGAAAFAVPTLSMLFLYWVAGIGATGLALPAGAETPEAEPEAPLEAAAPPRRADFRAGLANTRSGFIGRLDALLRGRSALDDETLAEVETVLFGADLGVKTANEMMQALRSLDSPDQIRQTLERRAFEILDALPDVAAPSASPHVVLVVGVNGSGKTTSIGKLAARWTAQGKKVLLGAADTYRAAAAAQLAIWADRSGAEILRGESGRDPAAVAFDALRAGVEGGFDYVLIDTAGRLQTDAGLMDQLAKMVRVMKKEIPDAPHEVLLSLDANTGQNAIRQAQEFTRAVDVTGIILSKLDGTAKGGVILGVSGELGIPVRYVGMGEGVDDLFDFDAKAFVESLFASE